MGDPIFIHGDDKSVLCKNASIVPESSLKKKMMSVAYHFSCCEGGVAEDKWCTAYIETGENPADVLTKIQSAGPTRASKVRMFMWDK